MVYPAFVISDTHTNARQLVRFGDDQLPISSNDKFSLSVSGIALPTDWVTVHNPSVASASGSGNNTWFGWREFRFQTSDPCAAGDFGEQDGVNGDFCAEGDGCVWRQHIPTPNPWNKTLYVQRAGESIPIEMATGSVWEVTFGGAKIIVSCYITIFPVSRFSPIRILLFYAEVDPCDFIEGAVIESQITEDDIGSTLNELPDGQLIIAGGGSVTISRQCEACANRPGRPRLANLVKCAAVNWDGYDEAWPGGGGARLTIEGQTINVPIASESGLGGLASGSKGFFDHTGSYAASVQITAAKSNPWYTGNPCDVTLCRDELHWFARVWIGKFVGEYVAFITYTIYYTLSEAIFDGGPVVPDDNGIAYPPLDGWELAGQTNNGGQNDYGINNPCPQPDASGSGDCPGPNNCYGMPVTLGGLSFTLSEEPCPDESQSDSQSQSRSQSASDSQSHSGSGSASHSDSQSGSGSAGSSGSGSAGSSGGSSGSSASIGDCVSTLPGPVSHCGPCWFPPNTVYTGTYVSKHRQNSLDCSTVAAEWSNTYSFSVTNGPSGGCTFTGTMTYTQSGPGFPPPGFVTGTESISITVGGSAAGPPSWSSSLWGTKTGGNCAHATFGGSWTPCIPPDPGPGRPAPETDYEFLDINIAEGTGGGPAYCEG